MVRFALSFHLLSRPSLLGTASSQAFLGASLSGTRAAQKRVSAGSDLLHDEDGWVLLEKPGATSSTAFGDVSDVEVGEDGDSKEVVLAPRGAAVTSSFLAPSPLPPAGEDGTRKELVTALPPVAALTLGEAGGREDGRLDNYEEGPASAGSSFLSQVGTETGR